MKKKIGIALFFVFYLIVILFRLANHFPWFDEAHAWIIAQEVPFNDLLSTIRIEGHPFLWFVMLMPFAKTGFLYPYALYILNTTFCILAIFILWKKSNFNLITKCLITLSYPFFALYPIIARNYSIGILLLFILTAYYKDKFKHPILYTLTILLCLNSSVMAFFGATAFAILYTYDLFKNKINLKTMYIPCFNIILGYLLLCIQFLNKSTPIDIKLISNIKIVENLFIKNSIDLNILLLIIFGILTLRFLVKNKLSLFYIGFTYLCLTLCFTFIYPAGIWHSYFYYIYFIIALWLSNDKNQEKYKNILLCVVSFLLIFNYPNAELSKHLYGSEGKQVINTILKDNTLKNAHLIHNNGTIYTTIPYSKKYNLNITNYCDNPKGDYDLTTIHADNKLCKHDDGISEAQEHLERFLRQVDNNTIMITSDRYESNKYFLTDGKQKLYIEKYKCSNGFCYWKLFKF